jgi:1,4-dihydroxy-2-naphthoate octaprenyltransferase
VLTEHEVRRAGLAVFALAGLGGLGAVALGGWPILAIGVASVLAGLSYSDGPLPIAFTPFGEVFVTLFFGVAAVMGATWLTGAAPGLSGLLAGVAVGLPAAAVLLVNNHRDRVADERNGRRTLAILIGPTRSVDLHFALLVAPLGLAGVLAVGLDAPAVLISLVLLVPALRLRQLMRALPIGPGLNRALGLTALYQLGFAALLALGLIIG